MEPHKQRLSSMLKQQKKENPTGAGKKPVLRVTFDRRLKLEFHGSKVTSDAGLLAYRELDAALGLTDLGENLLNDWRTGKNTQQSMVALMRQSIFSRLAGYEDTNDAERLSVDPTMRQVVGGRATERTAVSTSQMGRFETEVLTQRGNLTELTKLSGKWIGRTEEGRNTVRLDSRRRHCACVHRLADLPLKRPLCGDYRLPICQRRKNSCNTHSIKYPFC